MQIKFILKQILNIDLETKVSTMLKGSKGNTKKKKNIKLSAKSTCGIV